MTTTTTNNRGSGAPRRVDRRLPHDHDRLGCRGAPPRRACALRRLGAAECRVGGTTLGVEPCTRGARVGVPRARRIRAPRRRAGCRVRRSLDAALPDARASWPSCATRPSRACSCGGPAARCERRPHRDRQRSRQRAATRDGHGCGTTRGPWSDGRPARFRFALTCPAALWADFNEHACMDEPNFLRA